MKPPRFIDRVLDSTIPVIGDIDRGAIVKHLSGASITLRADPSGITPVEEKGFLLLANLAARLYPSIRLDAPAALIHSAEGEIILINPRCDIQHGSGESTVTVCYGLAAREEGEIAVCARGWNVYVDRAPEIDTSAYVPAALLAATLGIGEAFRVLFAEQLGERGRREAKPFAFNLITLGEPDDRPHWPEDLDLGRFNLVGAGAVGQAAASTLSACQIKGTMVAIDHEAITLSNLQRYVVARDSDIGVVKVDLLAERLASEDFEIVPVRSKWHAKLAADGVPTLVALDTAEARIALQASLPGSIFNAWTQPADVGFSRHEAFGEEPCLACLHWPDHPRPSRYEQVAAAFDQHPARCLSYLVHRTVPVGDPLPEGAVQALPGLPNPAEAELWTQRSLLDDIAATAGVEANALAAWRHRSLADLYQEGVCGGAVLDLGVAEAPHEALVPLAHQSAFAGIMLATQLIAATDPKLREGRPDAPEGRYDVLSGGEQHLPRPRQPTAGCICSDDVYREVYVEKFAMGTSGGDQT